MKREKNSINSTYPALVKAIEALGEQKFIADGEIVAFKGKLTSFSELQKRMNLRDPDKVKGHNTAVYYYLFDNVENKSNSLDMIFLTLL